MREGIKVQLIATCPECGATEFDREFIDDSNGLDWDFVCLECGAIIMPDEFGLTTVDTGVQSV